jgi:hypothetical protein
VNYFISRILLTNTRSEAKINSQPQVGEKRKKEAEILAEAKNPSEREQKYPAHRAEAQNEELHE